jgi:hypothetical protein
VGVSSTWGAGHSAWVPISKIPLNLPAIAVHAGTVAPLWGGVLAIAQIAGFPLDIHGPLPIASRQKRSGGSLLTLDG